jgi:hypothetical protein
MTWLTFVIGINQLNCAQVFLLGLFIFPRENSSSFLPERVIKLSANILQAQKKEDEEYQHQNVNFSEFSSFGYNIFVFSIACFSYIRDIIFYLFL